MNGAWTADATSQKHTSTATEAVGVFDVYEDLFETVKDLGVNGFGRHQISVRGSDASVRERFGSDVISAYALEDAPKAPHSPLIGIDELGVAQGVLIGTAIYGGASLAFITTDGLTQTGSIPILLATSVIAAVIGYMLAQFLGEQYHRFFERQKARGGLVLWVETPDPKAEQTAQAILSSHGAHDVHLHKIAA